MKTRLIVILLLCSIAATAQDTTKNHSFALSGGLTFDNYGRLDENRNAVSTEYAGLKITPEWLFVKHWGLKIELGAAWAFLSNSSGTWETPMHSITNITLGLAPYYEFRVKQWFIDLGVVAGVRFRLPFMNGEMSRYLMTLSVGVGAQFRFGYMFTDNLGMYADLKAERTVYDMLYDAYYSSKNTPSGDLCTSLGIVYRF